MFVQFIANHLKASKNISNQSNKRSKQLKGSLFESFISLTLHPHSCPIAVSPMLLREYGLGQIDVALGVNGIIVIVETKAHTLSISASQQIRIKNSAIYLGQLFNCQVKGLLARESNLQNKVTFINLF